MTKIKNRPMTVMPVKLARRALWLLSLLLLPLFLVMSAATNSVSMVCKGLFVVERMHGKISKTEKFDCSVYVTVVLVGGYVMRQRLL